VLLRSINPVRRDAFRRWLAELLWDTGSMRILRGKGVIAMKDEGEGGLALPHKFIFQSVEEQFDVEEAQGAESEWGSEERKDTKIIFIGWRLDAILLQNGLDSC